MTGVESVGPTPMEMAKSLLSRRIMLKDALPGIIRNLQAEEESILPKLKRSVDRHQKSNNAVSELKLKRDALQKEAALILKDVKSLRTKIDESGGMIRLDPNWAKERLEEKLIDIETRIETQALDHKAERKLISIRSTLLKENEQWLQLRRDSNPLMVEYVSKRREMSRLFKDADKIHSRMIDLVEKGQPLHEKRQELEREHTEIRKQLDRAKELDSQSEASVAYWENVVKTGFEKGGGADLLRNSMTVKSGGLASFAKKSVKVGQGKEAGKMSEEGIPTPPEEIEAKISQLKAKRGSLRDERAMLVESVRGMRASASESREKSTSRRKYLNQFHESKKNADAARKERDEINLAVPPPVSVLEDWSSKSLKKLQGVDNDLTTMPTLSREIREFSRYFELNAAIEIKKRGK